MEGRIVSVLETWPLQLTVDAAAGRWSVSLTAETVVTEGGRDAGPERLGTGARVSVSGRETGPRAMIADRIALLR